MRKLLLLFLTIFSFACSKFNKVQRSTDVDLKYKKAIEYYEVKKDYYHAALLFEELIPLVRGQAESEKVNFYHAYSQYNQGNLVMSAYYFKRFYETFPRSDRAEEAEYMHALSLYYESPAYNLDQTNTYEAKNYFQIFIEKYPESKFAVESNQKVDDLNKKLEKKAYELAKLYYQIRDYKSALIAFDNVVRDHSNSPHEEELAFLKIDAAYQLALISIDEKKIERFENSIKLYQEFVDKYAQSKYLSQAEKLYEKAQYQMHHFHKSEKIKQEEKSIEDKI